MKLYKNECKKFDNGLKNGIVLDSHPPTPPKTAVLFLVFNRPDTTRKVFEAIRKAKPPRLYVAADGPREGCEGEAEKVAKVREIATQVDWFCQLKTLFRDQNLGCRFAPQRAIDWFFLHEEEGIILEDDCLPHATFFSYCEWALEVFRDNKSVWHISGNNFAAPKFVYEGKQYAFSPLGQVWGWATWEDRWRNYQGNPFYLSRESKDKIRLWRLSWLARMNKLSHLGDLKNGLDAWDYQWQITILNNAGMALSSVSNLISNLGDGSDATHTTQTDRAHLPTEPFQIPERSYPVEISESITRWYEIKMGLRYYRSAINYLIVRFKQWGLQHLYDSVAKIFFPDRTTIVIASSGRSGSTMLYDAVGASLIRNRFPFFSKFQTVRQILCKFSKSTFLDRIEDLAHTQRPVAKTHALYIPNYNKKAKFIFVYGDPLESAESVEQTIKKEGSIWLDEHLFHLEGKGYLDELYTKDILNYEKQIKTWLGLRRSDVYVCNYDQLWELRDELSVFIGFPLVLPERRPRSEKFVNKNLNKEMFKRLRSINRIEGKI